MSLNSVRLVCTALAGTNKQGVLKPDADGYYEVVLGGLNMFNSAGEYYVYEAAKSLFESSSQLQRRAARGALRGEYGHPKMLPGMSNEQFANRVMSIYEDMVSHHIKEVFLDFDRVKDDKGKPVIAIIGKIKPAGPYAGALQKSLETPGENVCFSIRAFTDDQRIGGVNHRALRTIVTWDYVNEPGLAVANKFSSPSLESIQDIPLTRGDLERSLENQNGGGQAMESVVLSAAELFASMGWNRPRKAPAVSRPDWGRW